MSSTSSPNILSGFFLYRLLIFFLPSWLLLDIRLLYAGLFHFIFPSPRFDRCLLLVPISGLLFVIPCENDK